MSGTSDAPNPGSYKFDMPVQEAKFKEVVQELKKIGAGSDEEKATLKRIWDMFADMRDTSTYSQFQYIVYHLDGRFSKADLTHTLNFLGKDATKPIAYKDFTDWYQSRDQLKQDSSAGKPTKRGEKSGSSISRDGSKDEITDGKRSMKRSSSFRKTFSIVTGKDSDKEDKKEEKKEEKKDDKKDKKDKEKEKDKKKDKKDKHASSSGSQVITNKPTLDPSPRRGTDPAPVTSNMEGARSAAATLRGTIDKEAYKRAMLERYEAQQRENAEILKKKKDEDEVKKATLGRSSTGVNVTNVVTPSTAPSTLGRSTIASASFYQSPSSSTPASPQTLPSAVPQPLSPKTSDTPVRVPSGQTSQPMSPKPPDTAAPVRVPSGQTSQPMSPKPVESGQSSARTPAPSTPTAASISNTTPMSSRATMATPQSAAIQNKSFENELKAQDDLIQQLNMLAKISPRYADATVHSKDKRLSTTPDSPSPNSGSSISSRTAGAPSIVVSPNTPTVTPLGRAPTTIFNPPSTPAATTAPSPASTQLPQLSRSTTGAPNTLRAQQSTMEILMSSISEPMGTPKSAAKSPRPSGIHVAQPAQSAFVDPELQRLNEELAQIERERAAKRDADRARQKEEEESRKMNELLAIASGNKRHSLMRPKVGESKDLAEKKKKEEELQRSLELLQQQREMEERAAADQARALLNAPLVPTPKAVTPRNDDLKSALAAVESHLKATKNDEKERAAAAEIHRIEVERMHLEAERMRFQREQEELKRTIEIERQENLRKQKEQEALREQLENERLENVKRVKEQEHLQRLAALERQLLVQQNEDAKLALRAQFEKNESLARQRAEEEEARREQELADKRELEEMKRVEESIQQKRDEVRRFKQEQQWRRSKMVTGEQMRALQAAVASAELGESEKLRLERERLRLEKEEMERIEAEKQAIINERKKMEEDRLKREREHQELRKQYEREREEAAKLVKAQEELRAELMRKKQEEDRVLEAQLLAEDEELRLMELKIQQKRNALQAKRKQEEEERLRRLEQLEQHEDVEIRRRREQMEQKMAELNQQLKETQLAELKQQQDRIREMEERLRQVKVTGGRAALTTMDPQLASVVEAQQSALARMQNDLLNLPAPQPVAVQQAAAPSLPSEVAAALAALKDKEKQLKEWEERNLQMQSLLNKMSKLDRFESLMQKIEAGELVPGGGKGGSSNQSFAELQAEVMELQKIIFSDTATAKEKEDANIKLEKAMTALEQTPEAREAVRKAKEERRQKNEPLNRAALASWRAKWTPDAIRRDETMLRRIAENPELRLLLVDPELISRMHQNDFKAYTLKNISLEEMRGIRGNMPVWRKDQAKQQEWQDALDDRIDATEAAVGQPKAPPKKAPSKMPPLPKAKAAGGAPPGDLFAELLAKKNSALKRAPPQGSGEISSTTSRESSNSDVSSLSARSSAAGSAIRMPAPPLPPPQQQPVSPHAGASQPLSPHMTPQPPAFAPPPPPGPSYGATAQYPPLPPPTQAPPKAPAVTLGTNLTSTDLSALRAAAAAANGPMSPSPASAPPPAAGGGGTNTGNQLRMLNDALLKLTNINRDEKEVAADTRTSVLELKKFCSMHMVRNQAQAQALEAIAPELVVAVKKALAARARSNDTDLREASAEIQRVCRKINDAAFDLML